MKVSIGGEYFEFDAQRKPLAEMLMMEDATGIAYGQWESGLQRGTAEALGVLAWLLWHRAGRDVSWDDIKSGKAELNLAEMRFEDTPEPPGPTTRPGAPEASPMTGTGTPGRSRKSSA